MAYLFGLSHCPLMLQEKLTSPQALPVSKCSCLTTEAPSTRVPLAVLAQHQPQVICPPRSQPALRLHRGLTARQRALSVNRAWSEGHWNLRLLLISTHFLVILVSGPTTAQLILLILFTYLYTNYLISSNLFQLPPTELLNSAYLRLFTSQRGHHTGWRGSPSFIYPKSPDISTLPWENSAPNAFFPSQCQYLNLHPPGHEFTALCQMATPNSDQRRDTSTVTGCFKFPRLIAHLPWLTTRQWDKSQTFHCLTDFP